MRQHPIHKNLGQTRESEDGLQRQCMVRQRNSQIHSFLFLSLSLLAYLSLPLTLSVFRFAPRILNNKSHPDGDGDDGRRKKEEEEAPFSFPPPPLFALFGTSFAISPKID